MTKTKCYYNILITENYPSQLLYFVKFIWAQYGKIFKLRIQMGNTWLLSLVSQVQLFKYFAILGSNESDKWFALNK